MNIEVEVTRQAQGKSSVEKSSETIIDQSKYQRQTPTEQEFLKVLVETLKQHGFALELSVQESLIIPLRRARASDEIKRQLTGVLRRYSSAKYCVRRPDIYSEKYGLVIEIDGNAHDFNGHCARRDQTREAEYATLGLSCYIIRHDDFYNSQSKQKILLEIVQLFKQEEARPTFIQAYQRRRKAISRARKQFSNEFSDGEKYLGRYDRRSPTRRCYAGFKGKLQWLGYRIKINQAKIKDAPLSSSEPTQISSP